MTSPFESSLTETDISDTDEDLRSIIANVEKRVLERTLNEYRWHRSKVARHLGVDRKTLFTKMKRYGLNQSPGR